MNSSNDKKHDLLLVITSVLFILFTAGLAVPSSMPIESTIIPPG